MAQLGALSPLQSEVSGPLGSGVIQGPACAPLTQHVRQLMLAVILEALAHEEQKGISRRGMSEEVFRRA